MTLRHMEYALEVAASGSINKAAKKMLVSQPYLSGVINSLERELGYELFERTRSGIACTEEGALFMEHAELIMSELAEIKSLSGSKETPLKVASYYSRFITELFLDFRNSQEVTQSDRLREMGNMEVIESVAKREYNLGIIYHAHSKKDKFMKLAETNNLEYHTLFASMDTFLIMSKDHPLASKERINREELRSCGLVFFEDASTILYMVEHLKLPKTATDFSVSDRGGFNDALASGRYISVINTPFPELEKQFILKDISDCMSEDADFEVGSAYLYRRDYRLTEREREFLTVLRREK